MTTKTIHRLKITNYKITNYKSIDSLELEGLMPFSVFAGPNGSGKSNFFDTLDFVGLFVRGGVETALREHGGFANIHSEKCSKEDAKNSGLKSNSGCPMDESIKRIGQSLSTISSRFMASMGTPPGSRSS